MAQGPPPSPPIPNYRAGVLYDIEDLTTILEDLQEASFALVLMLNSIVAGITTPQSARRPLPELIRPNAELAVDILRNINRLRSILPPVIQGQVVAGKNMNLERKRNIKRQRKTKRRRL